MLPLHFLGLCIYRALVRAWDALASIDPNDLD
jgi:hypothetical protein